MPLISVIIPAYNAEKTIKETIESVLNQTFSDFELIVVNDGSQDSTSEIASRISDPRLKVFSYPNSGASVSRNRGFEHAVGELIAFLDADDLWSSDKLEAQLAALEANPQADIAYSWTDCIDESGQFLRRGGHITVNGDALEKLLMMDILENGSTPLIRRQALTEVGGFDESLQAGQDWDLYLRLAADHYFVAVPRSQVFYRISSNSLSANVRKLESACLYVLDRAYSKAPESLQHLKPYSIGNLYKYLTYKALEGNLDPRRGLIAVRFLCQAIQYDRSLLRTRVIFKVLFKALVISFLPPSLAQALLMKLKQITNPITLLGYLQLDPL